MELKKPNITDCDCRFMKDTEGGLAGDPQDNFFQKGA